MVREPIKDFYSRIIGWVETKPNGDKIFRDFYNRIVGYYDKQANVTRDFYNRVVSRGDTGVSLIQQAEMAYKK